MRYLPHDDPLLITWVAKVDHWVFIGLPVSLPPFPSALSRLQITGAGRHGVHVGQPGNKVITIFLLMVSGSRGWASRETIIDALELTSPDILIQGGASGPDTVARQWAEEQDIPVITFRAEWGKYGGSAGIIRNNVMLDKNPSLVLAFWRDESAGTGHVIRECKRRGIPVEVYREFERRSDSSD